MKFWSGLYGGLSMIASNLPAVHFESHDLLNLESIDEFYNSFSRIADSIGTSAFWSILQSSWRSPVFRLAQPPFTPRDAQRLEAEKMVAFL